MLKRIVKRNNQDTFNIDVLEEGFLVTVKGHGEDSSWLLEKHFCISDDIVLKLLQEYKQLEVA